MSDYAVVLKKVAPVRVAQVHALAPSIEQLVPTLDRAFDQVMGYITQQGATYVGPGTTLYYDPEMRESDINVSVCLPFEGALKDGEQVKVSELPGFETVASVIHHGPFSTLSHAYNAIFHWIETNGYQVSGPSRELDLEYERGGDQSKFVTEIQFPVEKR